MDILKLAVILALTAGATFLYIPLHDLIIIIAGEAMVLIIIFDKLVPFFKRLCWRVINMKL
jgi:hypothetical protein